MSKSFLVVLTTPLYAARPLCSGDDWTNGGRHEGREWGRKFKCNRNAVSSFGSLISDELAGSCVTFADEEDDNALF